MTLKINIPSIALAAGLICSNLASATEMSFGKQSSAACAGCHGLKGISTFPFRPNLAGQDTDYIVSQLKAFKSGFRTNETMKQISESLSNEEMTAIANFYARQSTEIIKGGDPVLIKKGKEKYALCWSCHGDNGEGPGSYPSVAGQHAQYTVQQLKDFKSGSRTNPEMKAIASMLSIKEMEALGVYISTLTH
ncbi:MAG: c-type cytochrome [Methylococcaceae bacterium]